MYGDELAASYTFTFSKAPGESAFASRMRFLDTSSKGLSFFSIDAEGNVYIGDGDSKKAIGELTEELTTFRIVVDFAGSAILAYDENGNVIETLEVESPNAEYATLEEWRQSLVDRNYILNWRAEGLGSICIESMRIEEGNAFN